MTDWDGLICRPNFRYEGELCVAVPVSFLETMQAKDASNLKSRLLVARHREKTLPKRKGLMCFGAALSLSMRLRHEGSGSSDFWSVPGELIDTGHISRHQARRMMGMWHPEEFSSDWLRSVLRRLEVKMIQQIDGSWIGEFGGKGGLQLNPGCS